MKFLRIDVACCHVKIRKKLTSEDKKAGVVEIERGKPCPQF